MFRPLPNLLDSLLLGCGFKLASFCNANLALIASTLAEACDAGGGGGGFDAEAGGGGGFEEGGPGREAGGRGGGGVGRADAGGEGRDNGGADGLADSADARAFAAIDCALALASATICAGLFLGGGGCSKKKVSYLSFLFNFANKINVPTACLGFFDGGGASNGAYLFLLFPLMLLREICTELYEIVVRSAT